MLGNYVNETVEHINHTVTLLVQNVQLIDADCPTTQISFYTDLTLHDTAVKQTLFYAVHTATFDASDGTLTPNPTKPYWYFKGSNTQTGSSGTFGFDDNLSSYNLSETQVGKPEALSIDLLPRLKEVINAGSQLGLDQDLSHWTISDAFVGDGIWGHVKSQATWSNFSLSLIKFFPHPSISVSITSPDRAIDERRTCCDLR